jgi:hypothetical protein
MNALKVFALDFDPEPAHTGFEHSSRGVLHNDTFSPHGLHVLVEPFGRERSWQAELSHHRVRLFLA